MFIPNDLTFDPGLPFRVRREMPKPQWYLGLDLGQRRDFSALASMELTWTRGARSPVTWEWEYIPTLSLLALDRFPLGTSYEEIPELVRERIRQIDATPRNHHEVDPRIDLVVDGGGPGPPVIDTLRQRLARRVYLRPVMITNGKGRNKLTGGYTGVPRRTLLSDALLVIANKTLRVPPDLENASELELEFAGLRAAGESATHDDLVMAVALGIWAARQTAPELIPDRTESSDKDWDIDRQRQPPPPAEDGDDR
jgi:hypothetical protein